MNTETTMARLTMLALAALLGLFTPAARAQQQGEVSVEARIHYREFYVGESVRLEVRAVNAAEPRRPVVNAPRGVSVAFQGEQRVRNSRRIVNGRVVSEETVHHTFIYAVSADRPGVYEIPPIAVEVDGRTLRTEPVSFRVREPVADEAFLLTASVDDETLYTGQAATLTLTWYIGAQQADATLASASLPDAFEVYGIRDPAAERAGSSVATAFGVQTTAERGRADVGGQVVPTATMRFRIIPKRAGTFDFNDLEITFDTLDPTTQRRVRAISRAEPIRVEVRDPPAAGRPDAYTGVIGSYALSLRAGPTSVNVGDPIELRLTVRGEEPMRGIDAAPDLSRVPGFNDFRLDPEGWRAQPAQRPGERVFTMTIRPTNAAVEAIPSVPLATFDPEAERYVIAATDPIPLEVREVREVTAADAIGALGRSGGPDLPRHSAAGEPRPLTPTGPGIWAVDAGASALQPDGFTLAAAMRRPAIAAAAMLPPALFAAAAVFRVATRPRDRAALRRRTAYARARARLRRGATEPAVRGYVADAFDRPAESVTHADCLALLGPASSDEARLLAKLVADAEAGRFAGGAGTPGAEVERREVLRALRTVERARRRAARPRAIGDRP